MTISYVGALLKKKASGARRFLVLCLAVFSLAQLPVFASDATNAILRISTDRSALLLQVGADRRLYQVSYGSAGPNSELRAEGAPRELEFYPPSGSGFILEPALQVFHSDGNTSTDLQLLKESSVRLEPDVVLTRLELKDAFYPLYVTLCFKAYQAEDVIEQWSEIRNDENRAVSLHRFASSSLVFRPAQGAWLTHFHGDWANEAQWVEEKLTSGLKVLDSKIGVRAHQFRTPSFMLSFGQEAAEESGEVLGGSLEWSGSFQFAFEVDMKNRVRALAGINPFGEQYRLAPEQTLTTPGMLWSWSDRGKGQVSRNFHRWARRFGMRDGNRPRPVLLNNWETTEFNFDEKRIVALFDGARALGAETFLLDDGWFGNRHPRNDDHAGLGDWQVNTNKLPHGLSYLAEEAARRGLGFGIWIEPEMVNPASDLFEQHPDWAIGQRHREPILGRNQRVLDLSRPEVGEFVWNVVKDTLGPNPGITYLKWDCNCYVTQPGSFWLGPEEQTHLLIDYQRTLYSDMGRFATNFPNVMAMLCSGGAGRLDYGALKFFHSFWPSDNTDPAHRVFIQWGFGHFFPASSMANHVTRMGNRSLKFALDVAMSGALGFDLDITKLSETDRALLVAGVELYKTQVRDLVTSGDFFRLDSPYTSERSAIEFVSEDKSHALVFVYQVKNAETKPLKLSGLAADKVYRVTEINVAPGKQSEFSQNQKQFKGAELQTSVLIPPVTKEWSSALIELRAE